MLRRLVEHRERGCDELVGQRCRRERRDKLRARCITECARVEIHASPSITPGRRQPEIVRENDGLERDERHASLALALLSLDGADDLDIEAPAPRVHELSRAASQEGLLEAGEVGIVVGADDIGLNAKALRIEPEILDEDLFAPWESVDDRAAPLLLGDRVDVERDAPEGSAAAEISSVNPAHQNAPRTTSPLATPSLRARVAVTF